MGAGSADSEDLKDWWVLDLETEIWSQKMDIPGPDRYHPYQFGIDDGIYVGGGHIGNWMKWDINAETWNAIDDFPQGRVAGTQFSYDGKGYVLGGDNMQHGVLDDHQFLIYFPELDQ